MRVIQALLGHARLDTTAFYTPQFWNGVATRTIRAVTSPLDKLTAAIADGRTPGG